MCSQFFSSSSEYFFLFENKPFYLNISFYFLSCMNVHKNHLMVNNASLLVWTSTTGLLTSSIQVNLFLYWKEIIVVGSFIPYLQFVQIFVRNNKLNLGCVGHIPSLSRPNFKSWSANRLTVTHHIFGLAILIH
jgi:hypothetical protein